MSRKKSVKLSGEVVKKLDKIDKIDQENSLLLNKSISKDIESLTKKDWRTTISQVSRDADDLQKTTAQIVQRVNTSKMQSDASSALKQSMRRSFRESPSLKVRESSKLSESVIKSFRQKLEASTQPNIKRLIMKHQGIQTSSNVAQQTQNQPQRKIIPPINMNAYQTVQQNPYLPTQTTNFDNRSIPQQTRNNYSTLPASDQKPQVRTVSRVASRFQGTAFKSMPSNRRYVQQPMSNNPYVSAGRPHLTIGDFYRQSPTKFSIVSQSVTVPLSHYAQQETVQKERQTILRQSLPQYNQTQERTRLGFRKRPNFEGGIDDAVALLMT